ncbi:MAG: hypothetical protein J0G96_07110 [Flavobacteriia bacterium]|nr:hypothetical protein [Flavobacteriia bacterium]OJX36637.1 MAG: hypothetical protein BGO87_12620 [Flavobacteriia bacterium 40-80]
MNRLTTTYNGGFNLKMNDFRWIETGLFEAFKGLASPLLNNNTQIILSGCSLSISGGTLTLTEGFIFLNNEVFFVPSQSEPDAGTTYKYFDVIESFDPSGLKEFKNGLTHDVYAIRRGKLIQSNTLPVGAVDYSSYVTAIQSIETQLKSRLSPMTTLVTQTIPPGETLEGTYLIRGWKDFASGIHLTGRRWAEDLSIGSTLFTLPAGYRPGTEQVLSLPLSSSAKMIQVTIQTNGEVKLKAWVNSVPDDYTYVISFDGVVFR